MRKAVRFLWPMLLFPAFASEPVHIVLKDGSIEVSMEPVALSDNMLVLRARKGNQLFLSKGLVDWRATWRVAPDTVAELAPHVAAVMSESEKDNKITRTGPIVITDETLALHRSTHVMEGNPNPGATIEEERLRPLARPVIEKISKGERVDLTDHLDDDRYVIFDFYADWCGPCRVLTPRLEAMVKKFPDKVALKKIDIVRWGTPVAKQYGIRTIPYARLYDPNGNKVLAGNGALVLRYLGKKAVEEGW